ncbi:MAG: hypothetical protein ABJ308_10050 [Halieaceae bacterium]
MIQHRILKEKSYAYVEVRQTPTLGELVRAARLLVKDADFSADLNRICDLSTANLSHFKIDELVQFVDFAKQYVPLSRTARVAIVAPDEARSGILRSFAELIDTGLFQMFYDPAEAVKWVQERPHAYGEDGEFCKILGGVA